MKVVIDIPKEDYDIIKNDGVYSTFSGEMKRWGLAAIRNGTPLPEGHGRIGDLDQILLWMIYKKGIIDDLKCGEIAPVFKDATIIEAESEEA